MKNTLTAVVVGWLLCGPLSAVEPTISMLPEPPSGQGTYPNDSISECALTSKWIVATGQFTDPATSEVKQACFVYDAATLRFRRRIPLDGFASDVAIEGDLLAVGKSSDNAFRGAVFVFNLLNGALVQKLTASDGEASDVLGAEVAISGKRVIATAPGDDDRGNGAGAVYLFDLPSGGESEKVLASDGQAGDGLGGALAVSGDLAVVGARGDDDRGSQAGAAYVFSLRVEKPTFGNVGPAFTQLGKLTASDGAADKNFGRAVGISGNIITVGSTSDVIGAVTFFAPAVYLFDATTRAQLRRISVGFTTGSSLAIDDGLILAGQAQGALSGDAVTLLDANSGLVVRSISPLLGPASNDFGLNLELSGGTALICDLGQVVVIRGLNRELPVTTVAKIGDVQPGVGARALRTIDAYQIVPVAGTSPRILLQGQLTGPSGRTALWAGARMNVAAITRETVFAGSIPLKITQPVSQQLFLAYHAQHTGPGFSSLNDTAIVVHPVDAVFVRPGSPNALYSEGQPVSLATMAGRVIKSFGQLAAGSADRLGFTAAIRSAGGAGSTVVTSANDSGAFVSGSASNVPTASLLEGQPSPLSGIQFGQVAPRIGMEGANGIVSAALTGDANANAGIFRMPGTLLVRKGQTAPGALPVTAAFRSFLGESTQRGLLFRATLTGAPSSQNEGLWTIFNNAPLLVAQKGVQVPGLATGLKISRFLRYNGGFGSTALIHATLSGPGVNSRNDGVILLGTRFGTTEPAFFFRILMREGQIAPDTGGQTIGTILQFDQTEAAAANAAVITTLTGAPASANLALWTVRNFGDGRAVRQRLRKGIFHGTAGTTALLTSLKMLIPAEPTGAGTKGLGNPVGEDRTALVLTFSNRQVIAGPIKDLEAEPEPQP